MSVGSAIVVDTAQTEKLPGWAARLRGERLVYVGETHTAWADHLLQLEVLRAMATEPGRLAIGVEWFQAKFQPVIDAYLAGEIDEGELLARSDYYNRWRFDYRLYRPIIQYAREQGIPIIALNASRELTRAIGRDGIDGLAAALRGELPDGYDRSDKGYESALREIYAQHPPGGRSFERFLEVQLTWDETMAQNASRYLAKGPDTRLLVLAGRGHVGLRSGIPDRITRRSGLRGLSIVTFSRESEAFNAADYLVLAVDQELPPAGLMKVLLDGREDGVYIQGFSDASPAEEAGAAEDDRIVSIEGRPVRYIADVKLLLAGRAPGDEIELVVMRAGLFGGEKRHAFTFALAGAKAAHPH